jgi:hypothetical protein
MASFPLEAGKYQSIFSLGRKSQAGELTFVSQAISFKLTQGFTRLNSLPASPSSSGNYCSKANSISGVYNTLRWKILMGPEIV